MLATRVPSALAEAFRADAERSGLSYNDLLGNLLAERYGFPLLTTPEDEAQMKMTA